MIYIYTDYNIFTFYKQVLQSTVTKSKGFILLLLYFLRERNQILFISY